MKRFRKLAVTLAAIAALVLLPASDALATVAAGPVTYAVRYVSDELGWRFQANASTFDASDNGRELYYLRQDIKDGDVVVIYNDSDSADALDLGNAHLSNLTYVQDTHFTIVYAGGVDDCYVLGGTSGTLNCDVKNAYVYDAVTFNFNKNVGNLYLYAAGQFKSNLFVEGTVGHLTACTPPGQQPYSAAFDYYDFPAGSLLFENGAFKPNALGFKTPQEHAQQPQDQTQPAQEQPTQIPSAQEQPAQAPADSLSDEYDEVPKTGQDRLHLWLFCGAAICFTGGLVLKYTEGSRR